MSIWKRKERMTEIEIPSDVVGESFHFDAIAEVIESATGRQPSKSGGEVFVTAVLVPEPANRYDPLAVAVMVNGVRVGHLPRGSCTAGQCASLSVMARRGTPATIPARIGWSSRMLFGVTLGTQR